MRRGHVDACSHTKIAGWAADSDRPNERLTVCISVNGRLAAEALADRRRNEMAKLGKYGDGHHGFLFHFPEPLPAGIEHRVEVRFQEDGRLLGNGEHVLAGEASPAAAKPGFAELQPILVTAPGRSGTTLMMASLARSPHIVAAELVPYELRLLSYYSAALNVLTAPADLERSTHPDRLEGDGFHIGFNPFSSDQYMQAFRDKAVLRDYLDRFLPQHFGAAIAEAVREYYRRLAADHGKTEARYFVEKNNNLHRPTRSFTRRVFGSVREIVIVRDPRDVLCSHMAYFESSPEKAYAQLSHACRMLLAIRKEAADDIHIMRYEDMVAGDAGCFGSLSAFLGTAIEPPDGPQGSRMFARHATSASPEASVGRWRDQLPEGLRERIRADWEVFLTTFGYSQAG